MMICSVVFILLLTLASCCLGAYGQDPASQNITTQQQRLVMVQPRDGIAPASCFFTQPDSAEFSQCRTAKFCWRGRDESSSSTLAFITAMDATSEMSLQVFLASFVINSGPTTLGGSTSNGGSGSGGMTVEQAAAISQGAPFGLEAQMDSLLSGISAMSNGTCLSITLPQLLSLEVPNGIQFQLLFDLSKAWLYTNTSLVPALAANQSLQFVVNIVHSAAAEPLTALGPVSLVNFALGAMTAWFPLPSTLPELALTVSAASNACIQQNVREPSISLSLWGLSPWTGPSASSLQMLWASIVAVIGAATLHLACVGMHALIRSKMALRKSCTALRFPSLTISWTLVSFGPLCYASYAVFRDAGFGMASSGSAEMILAVIVLLALVAACIAPSLVVRKTMALYLRTERRVHDAVSVLPGLMRVAMPRTLWGPSNSIRAFDVPLCVCTHQGNTRYATMIQWTWLLVGLATLAPWPCSARGCVAQEAISGLVLLMYSGMLVRTNPFRSKLLGWVAALQAFLLAVTLFLNAARCAESFGNVRPNQAIQTLFILLHSIGVGRGVVHVLCGLAEARMVRPVVWPPCEGLRSHLSEMMLFGMKVQEDDVDVGGVAGGKDGVAAVNEAEESGADGADKNVCATKGVPTVNATDDDAAAAAFFSSEDCRSERASQWQVEPPDDTDFIMEVHRRRQELQYAGLDAESRYREVQKEKEAAASVISRSDLLQEPLVWLGDPTYLLRSQGNERRSTRKLLEVARSEQSKAVLRGPMEKILRGEGLKPPSLNRHETLEIDNL